VQLKPPDEYDDVMFVLRFVDAITHTNRWVQNVMRRKDQAEKLARNGLTNLSIGT
jgi:hypothetical protein